MIKRFAINLLIIFIAFMGVIYGYTQSFGLSFYDRTTVYAADNSIDRQDLVDSFTAYCRSRNLLVNGTVLGSSAEWLGTTLNNIINTLGIDSNYLQAQINKEMSGNVVLRYAINQTGIGLFNRIFAELLQREDLEVGDTDVDKKVYSGEIYTDLDGNKCLIYVFPNTASGFYYSSVIAHGTPLKYSRADLISSSEVSYHVISGSTSNHTARNISVPIVESNGNYTAFTSLAGNYGNVVYANYPHNTGGTMYCRGFLTVMKDNQYNRYYLCCVTDITYANLPSEHYVNYYAPYEVFFDETSKVDDTDVYVTTPDDDPIKPDLPDDEPINIYPDGNTDTGGGGGGNDPDPDPDPNNPSGPALPDWGTDTEVNPRPDGDGWDIPFSMPNLNIDWSLKDIGHKFPFCIPSDIVSFYRTLSVEPEAPSIDAHIPLGSFYDWHFVADFSQYDRWAVIIRAVEYVGFVIGLIYFTVRLVKG